VERTSAFVMATRAFAKNRTAVIGVILLALVILTITIGPLAIRHDPMDQDIINRYSRPALGSGHLLGTDGFGRDVLARVIYGSRIALVMALSVIAVSLSIGTFIGIVSALKGGVLDYIITEIVNVLMAFPTLLVALILLSIVGPGFTNLIGTLVFVFSYRFVRLSRGVALSIVKKNYIEAAKAIGVNDLRIALHHILPNLLGDLVAIGSLWIGATILASAGLSFLGIGIQPPTPSLGNMVRTGISNLTMAPWASISPGLAISIIVLAFNMVGDGFRDALDPRLRS